MKANHLSKYLSIRVISSLMFATTRAWENTLAERDAEVPIGARIHHPFVRALTALASGQVNAREVCDDLRHNHSGNPWITGVRGRMADAAEWFDEQVAPRIAAVIDDYGYERNHRNPAFRIAGRAISGGPHWRVLWEDGTERIVYVVCSKWTRKRINAALTLVQVYAARVLRMLPATVVVVDLRRQELHQLQPLAEAQVAEAADVVDELVRRLEDQSA